MMELVLDLFPKNSVSHMRIIFFKHAGMQYLGINNF